MNNDPIAPFILLIASPAAIGFLILLLSNCFAKGPNGAIPFGKDW